MPDANLTVHSPARLRASLLLSFLLLAAALISGAQALAPAPAAAMVNEGEECDPLTTIDCEPTNGGGGGPVGTTTGGGAGGDEIVGEAIYVEGTLPPSPCRASSCLPSQIGGGSTGFLDRGGKAPRGPHPRGRATRVGEAAKGKAKVPTKLECERLKAGLRTPSAEARWLKRRGEEDALLEKLIPLWHKERVILAEAHRIQAEIERFGLEGRDSTDPAVVGDMIRLVALTRAHQLVKAEEEPIEAQWVTGSEQMDALSLEIEAERKALLKSCSGLHGTRQP